MSSFLDIIGALMIFGVVLVMSLNLNIFTMQKNTQYILRTSNQEKITGTESYVGLGGIIENDLYKIGVGDTLTPSITNADTNLITFRADMDNNGTVDSVKYFTSTPPVVPAGGNPNIKYLYRRQNTQSGTAGWTGVSSLRFVYLDEMGKTILAPVADTLLSTIRSIRVKMMVENSYRMKNDSDTTFAATYWETLVSPQNIK